MKHSKILYKNISFDNYATFKKCHVLEKGRSIRFVMACGVTYEVTLSKLLTWFYKPHYYFYRGRYRDWREEFKKKINKINKKNKRVIKTKRCLVKTGLRVYLNDKTAYVVAWDTVLTACEPKYEGYVGLVKGRKKKC